MESSLVIKVNSYTFVISEIVQKDTNQKNMLRFLIKTVKNQRLKQIYFLLRKP